MPVAHAGRRERASWSRWSVGGGHRGYLPASCRSWSVGVGAVGAVGQAQRELPVGARDEHPDRGAVWCRRRGEVLPVSAGCRARAARIRVRTSPGRSSSARLDAWEVTPSTVLIAATWSRSNDAGSSGRRTTLAPIGLGHAAFESGDVVASRRRGRCGRSRRRGTSVPAARISTGSTSPEVVGAPDAGSRRRW